MTAAQMLLFPEETLPSRSAVPVSPKPTRKPSLPVPPTNGPSTNGPSNNKPAEPCPPITHPTAVEAIALPPIDSKGRAQQLRDQLARLQGKHTVQDDAAVPVYSTGGEVLDKWLPHRGLRPGTTVQWIGERSSDCAASLALIAAGQIALSANSGGKPLVIFDLNKTYSFYPPLRWRWGCQRIAWWSYAAKLITPRATCCGQSIKRCAAKRSQVSGPRSGPS